MLTYGHSGAQHKPAQSVLGATNMATYRQHALQESSFIPPRQRTAGPSVFATTSPPVLTLLSVDTLISASSVKVHTLPQRVLATAPLELHQPTTPINIAHLECELAHHPDKSWISQVLHNLTHGAKVGFTGTRRARLAPNLASARLYPSVIDEELSKECTKGHIAGPYPTPPLPNLQCSGVGLVLKKNGKWRMIMHLSAPYLENINDGICKEAYTLHYSTVDDVARIANKLGQGCFMAKIDLKSAFRLIPISKDDWELLGIHWQGSFYVDKQLPFGLRSAPFLFNQLAMALHWILTNNCSIPHLVHYLDDFLILEPSLSACQQSTLRMTRLCQELRIPIAWEKVEGPSTQLTFLGIEMDTTAWVLRLPQEKLWELLDELEQWSCCKSCTKHQLLSLIGKLSFAIPAGRIFFHHLIDLSKKVQKLHYHLNLNSEAREDIHWWRSLLPSWNSFYQTHL